MREKAKIKLLQNMLEEVTKKYDYFISLQNEKMKHTFEMAVKDSLTGLYNRQYLDEYSKQALGRVERYENILVLIFIDLDNFKYVNDYFGHSEGDEVLRKIAKIFQKTFRNYDIVVRYGGDEFIVLIEDKHYDKVAITAMLKKFVKRVEESLKEFKLSASYGCAVAPNETKDIEKLIELADERMYLQKGNKKVRR
jgi:diguanylate cyclase (GGDEF)-like protein